MQGFFVEVEKGKKYEGPYTALNEARDTARKIGPHIPIYHGRLNKNDDGSYDTSEIYLIPKVKK